jgi:hypothetical protein
MGIVGNDIGVMEQTANFSVDREFSRAQKLLRSIKTKNTRKNK